MKEVNPDGKWNKPENTVQMLTAVIQITKPEVNIRWPDYNWAI